MLHIPESAYAWVDHERPELLLKDVSPFPNYKVPDGYYLK